MYLARERMIKKQIEINKNIIEAKQKDNAFKEQSLK
jgi:hypothetical protein